MPPPPRFASRQSDIDSESVRSSNDETAYLSPSPMHKVEHKVWAADGPWVNRRSMGRPASTSSRWVAAERSASGAIASTARGARAHTPASPRQDDVDSESVRSSNDEETTFAPPSPLNAEAQHKV